MKNILKIISISKPLHKLVLVIGGLILTGALLDLIPPILSKFIVDEIVKKLNYEGGSVNTLAILIGIGFALHFIGTLGDTVSERLGDHFAGRLRKFLTEKFYDKVLSLPQSYFDGEISGKIVNQLNRAISSIQNFINSATNFILPTFLQSVLTIAVLSFYSLPIAFFTFLLFPIYMSLSYYSSKRWGVEEVKKNAIEDLSRGRIQEVVGNIRLVKSFNNELNEFKFIQSNLDKSNAIYAVQSRTFHIFDFFRNLSLITILLLINIVAFYQTFQGNFSIGTLVLILQLVNQARRPLFAMSFILTNIQNAEAGSKEYFEILELPSKEHYSDEEKTASLENPTIEFKNVSFNYERSEIVLDKISFKLDKKESVALVGHSGAGKSTIINLILKFYEPTVGQIFLKGSPYLELSHKFIRNNIALVFQENELFSTSIRENVAYGNLTATDEEIIAALKKANAYEFVERLSKGINSEVGERGVRLSGGQKQRIQIARAMLKDSPILILDEATSSLDAKSEREVHQALDVLMKDRLVIIIAHRFSTIQNVDKIFVLDGGKVVESGNPGELAKKPGIYSELLNYQIEGNRKLLEKFDITN
mgnify:FL=1